MVEEALRDPISVKMLKIDGVRIMEITGEKPGPKLGHTLNALLEEVLDNPEKNTPLYLEKTAQKLRAIAINELKVRGEAGKIKRDREEEEAVAELHKKHKVD